MKIIGLSDMGLVKFENEDCYVIDDKVLYNERANLDNCSIAFICDGVSHSNNGKNASMFVCNEIAKNKDILLKDEKDIISLIDDINKRLSKTYKDSFTTIAGIIYANSSLRVINVGDSKVISYKDNTLQLLSVDDSYYEYLKRNNSPEYELYKNSHAIVSCLGSKDFDKKDIHLLNIEEGIEDNELLIICSDGITDMIEETKLIEIISSSDSLENKAQLIENEVRNNGARDNYTLILIEK